MINIHDKQPKKADLVHRKSLAGDSGLNTSMENYFSEMFGEIPSHENESFGSMFSKYQVKGSVISNFELNEIDEEDSQSQMLSSAEEVNSPMSSTEAKKSYSGDFVSN